MTTHTEVDSGPAREPGGALSRRRAQPTAPAPALSPWTCAPATRVGPVLAAGFRLALA